MRALKPTNRALLLRALFENEIKAVTAHFSGSGDSGEISSLDIKSVDDETAIDEDTLEQIVLRGVAPAGDDNTMEWADGNYVKRDFDKRPMTLHELAMMVCYDELEMAHGGWEINAGSFGKIFITVPLGGRECVNNAAVYIEYNEYEEDYDDYEDEEYNDE